MKSDHKYKKAEGIIIDDSIFVLISEDARIMSQTFTTEHGDMTPEELQFELWLMENDDDVKKEHEKAHKELSEILK